MSASSPAHRSTLLPLDHDELLQTRWDRVIQLLHTERGPQKMVPIISPVQEKRVRGALGWKSWFVFVFFSLGRKSRTMEPAPPGPRMNVSRDV